MGIINKNNKDITTIYSLKPKQIKELIATDLGVPIDEIEIDFIIEEVGGDFMDRYPGHNEVTKISVKHTKKERNV